MISPERSRELLQRYAATRCGAAFRELVEGWTGLVYGAALRVVRGQEILAEDVAQTVFFRLAAAPQRVKDGRALAAWLHAAAIGEAKALLRAEVRRRRREQASQSMNMTESMAPGPQDTAPELAAEIDSALHRLRTQDCQLLLMRFWQQQDWRSIGKTLGMSDDAAQKRMSRALDRLRCILTRRGITAAGALPAILTGALTYEVPAATAGRIAAAAKAHAAMHTTTSIFTALAMTSKTKLALASAILLVTALLPAVYQQRRIAELESELAALDRKPAAAYLSGAEKPGTVAANAEAPALAKETAEARQKRLWTGLYDVSDARRRLNWGLILDEMKAEDAPWVRERLAEIIRHGGSIGGQLEDFWQRWGELDGVAAMKAVVDEGTRPTVAQLRNAALTGWVMGNPGAALQWLKDEGAGAPGREAMIRAVIQTLARSDPEKAQAFLTRSLNANEREGMARDVVYGTIYTRGLDGALPFVERLLADTSISPAGRNDAATAYLTGCLRGYPGEFERLLAFSRDQPWFDPGVVNKAFARAAGDGIPSSVLENAHLMPEGKERERVIGTVVNRWMQLEPSTVGNWMNSHRNSPVYNSIAAHYAVLIKEIDPGAAATWAGTINDPARREEVLRALQVPAGQ